MRRLAQHRTQLDVACLGDVPRAVRVSGLIRGGDQTSVAGNVFRGRESVRVGDRREGGECDDGADARDLPKTVELLCERLAQLLEADLEFRNLVRRGVPENPMLVDEVPKLGQGNCSRPQPVRVRINTPSRIDAGARS